MTRVRLSFLIHSILEPESGIISFRVNGELRKTILACELTVAKEIDSRRATFRTSYDFTPWGDDVNPAGCAFQILEIQIF